VVVAHEADHLAADQPLDFPTDLGLHDDLPASTQIEHGRALAGLGQARSPSVSVSWSTTKTPFSPSVVLALVGPRRWCGRAPPRSCSRSPPRARPRAVGDQRSSCLRDDGRRPRSAARLAHVSQRLPFAGLGGDHRTAQRHRPRLEPTKKDAASLRRPPAGRSTRHQRVARASSRARSRTRANQRVRCSRSRAAAPAGDRAASCLR
jgi:hypothetical protein